MLLCPWEKHLTLSFQLAAVQLKGKEQNFATARLSTLRSVPELGNASLCPWTLTSITGPSSLPVVEAQSD